MAKALAPIDFANPAEGVKKMIRKMEQEEAGVREDVLASSQGLNDGEGEARVLGSEARELNRLISGVVKKMESAGEEEVQDPDILVLTSQSLFSAREVEGIRCMFETAMKLIEGAKEKGVTRELLRMLLVRFLGPSKRIAKNVSYRLFAYMCTDTRLNQVVLLDFVVGMSALVKGRLEDKLNACYTVFDLNEDGYISTSELAIMLISGLLGEYGASDVDQIMRRLTGGIMKKHPQGLDYDAFCTVVQSLVKSSKSSFSTRFVAHIEETAGKGYDVELASRARFLKAAGTMATDKGKTGTGPSMRTMATMARAVNQFQRMGKQRAGALRGAEDTSEVKKARTPAQIFKLDGLRSVDGLQFSVTAGAPVNVQEREVMEYAITVMRMPHGCEDFTELAKHRVVASIARSAFWYCVARLYHRDMGSEAEAVLKRQLYEKYTEFCGHVVAAQQEQFTRLLVFTAGHAVFLIFFHGFRLSRERFTEEFRRQLLQELMYVFTGVVVCSMPLDHMMQVLYTKKADEYQDESSGTVYKPKPRAQRPRRRLRAAMRGRMASDEGSGAAEADEADGGGSAQGEGQSQGVASRRATEAMAKEQDFVAMPLQWLVPRAAAPGRGAGSPKRVEKFNAYKLSPLMESRYHQVPKSVEMKRRHVVLRSIPPLEGGPAFDHVTFTSTTANAEQASRMRASQSTPTLPPASPIAGAGRGERKHLGKHDGTLRGASSPPVGEVGDRPATARGASELLAPVRMLRGSMSQPTLHDGGQGLPRP